MDVLKTAMFNRNCNFPSKVENMRSHGWQLPLHPLQIVGMAVYSFLVVAFYAFLGPFLGNRIVEITVISVFSFVVLSVIFLFIRCTATDPTDKTSLKKKRRAKTCGFSNMNYWFLLGQIVVRFLRKVERKFLKCFIRRKYLDPWKMTVQMEPLLFFPLVTKDDAVTPGLQDDISFCSLCDFEVKKHSKHCRTCNRCVEGFDHHCRWLNNCIGKKNYTTFILLMVSVLLTLVIEGGTAIAIFIRCFADGKGIEQELESKLHIEFPRGVLAAISVFLVLMTAYSLAALGQLFFFHVVLIRKGMRTYDYILAMKEENQSIEAELYNDFDSSSDDSSDFDSPEKPTLVSRFICRGGHQAVQNPKKLSIRIEGEPESSNLIKKPGFRASIDPWKLIKMSREKALMAAEKARERLMKQKPMLEEESLKPLPLETKCGPLMNPERNTASTASGTTPLISKGWFPGSPGRFSSPRRRISGSPTMFSGVVVSPKQTYRSSFDLKITEVSRELETYISKQVLCSALKQDGVESPR